MRIQLNGVPRETEAATLDALLIEAGYADAVVATAVNGDFVPAAARASTTLNQGDAIEVVAPMQGG
ncbi:sulfur carrier protein [Litoreibacter ponti]|uniref:Sulfur carrier protein n=1 Tax=Litoreibacter ponti TaxID=1510457 RepID=A0A2T6BJ94_9RHOB|nr:sulfur carrier protein ThiS [Litoreibacter ponti]PTX56125.1 sulfur carrier protein [Litoreibacter ponti]